MTVNLIINGQPIQAEPGKTILQVAKEHDVRIPTLCYHKDLSPTGNCRMCVVDVKGGRTLQAACVTPVWEGMEIETNTEKVMQDRKLTLELMLANHPQDCLICDAAGECELQDLAYEYKAEVPVWGAKGTRYLVDSDPNPFIRVDMNKCILCRRCESACAEIQVRDVWGVSSRGFDSVMVAGAGVPMLEARCESCGQCVAYCPTGALSNKMSYGVARAHQVTKVTTTCSYCGVGCQFDLLVKDNKVIGVGSNPNAPVNGMTLCVKGRYGYDYIHHPDRLAKPRVRRYLLEGGGKPVISDQLSVNSDQSSVNSDQSSVNSDQSSVNSDQLSVNSDQSSVNSDQLSVNSDQLSVNSDQSSVNSDQLSPFGDFAVNSGQWDWVEVEWDAALDVVTKKFAETRANFGADSMGFLTSAKCLNEENYLMNKLARQVVGTNNIDHCARL